jgi:hypothetical protein
MTDSREHDSLFLLKFATAAHHRGICCCTNLYTSGIVFAKFPSVIRILRVEVGSPTY